MTNNPADTLKRCPLCKSDAVQYNAPHGEGYGGVQCVQCGLFLSNNITGWEKDKNISIKVWNTRAPSEKPTGDRVAALEALKRPVRKIPDGHDMEDNPYDVGWNNALKKAEDRLQTEITMHKAWRKRAEEAEEVLNRHLSHPAPVAEEK